MDVNKYLYRIKKKDSPEWECSKGEQSITHVLTEFEVMERARMSDRENQTVIKLLWTTQGIKTALQIWKQFTKWRHDRGGRNEDREEEAREMERGWSGLRDSQ